MADHKLKTCITFHHRTMDAQAYAEGLERVTGKLHADQPEKYPKRIWADWLCGEHVPEYRRQVLGSFGTTARRTVLSNCRVLGEGVDIRAVDSVALLDPKGAPHDIVQATGRAPRHKPGEGKLSSFHPQFELARCRVRTAWTRLVMRVVEHRSLRRSHQDLRVATARSTRAQVFAWDRLAPCWPAGSVSHRPRQGTRTVPSAPW
jgi:superfamily II DNA or RNA helicase